MKRFTHIRNYILGLGIALLILVQCIFSTGLPFSYVSEKASPTPYKTEVKQDMAIKTSYVVADTRITLSTFLYFWIVRIIGIDVPLIVYLNCKAFFIHPHSFNIYYTCLSALAP